MNAQLAMLAGVTLMTSTQVTHAQEPTAVAVQYGDRIALQLTTTDPTFGDGSHYQMFGFAGAAGDSVSVSLVSADLDAYLILADTQGQEVQRDDDSGGRCNAHVATVLPDSGTYIIYAAAATAGEWGDVTLSLDRGLLPAPSMDACRGFISPNGILALEDSVVGALTQDDPFLGDSTYYEVWMLSGTAGKTFTVDLTSEQFDAVLLLLRGLGTVVAVDDDGGGGCNSRIVYQDVHGAPLRLVARTRGNWQMGDFMLRLSDGAQAQEASSCEGRSAGRPPERR